MSPSGARFRLPSYDMFQTGYIYGACCFAVTLAHGRLANLVYAIKRLFASRQFEGWHVLEGRPAASLVTTGQPHRQSFHSLGVPQLGR